VCRREIAPGGRSPSVSGGRSRADVEGRDRVVDDVLRQHVHMPSLIVEAKLERLLEILRCHPNEADVTEIHQFAAADDRRDTELPSADDSIDDRLRSAAEPMALAERQIVNGVQLERVSDVSRIACVAEI